MKALLNAAVILSTSLSTGAAMASEVPRFSLLERLEASGQELAPGTQEWMKNWRGLDLDDKQFQFKELSGSSSINLKIRHLDATEKKGYKSAGSFVPRNSGANPNIEVASFHLAALLGQDVMYRPAANYKLGPQASASFKGLINVARIRGSLRLENQRNILASIASGRPLVGALKAKKTDSALAIEDIADPHRGPLGAPRVSHPLVQLVQASSAQPRAGQRLRLAKGYEGDELTLAKELSVMMTIDAVFEQWDRYSGGNIVARLDKSGRAHLYATDNGGASLMGSTRAVTRNASYFSRYDRAVIKKLRELAKFMRHPETGYLGYKSVEEFVVDLGLQSEAAPSAYAKRLSRNLGLFLEQVAQNEQRYGNSAYFE